MELNQVYKQLTSVDIIEQKQIWDERGRGYYGEYLLFCELYKNIDGCCKILMNLEIPAANGRKTEIDLIMIHETGLYVFEVKHYKGTIYGKDTDSVWTQYFRTTSNSVFRNPVLQNGYHIRALQNIQINVPIRSFIVFTNEECDIRVSNSNSEIAICNLYGVCKRFNEMSESVEKRYTIEDINAVFNKLSVYSKMSAPVSIKGKEADFSSWVEPVISKLEDEKKELEAEKKNCATETEKAKRRMKIGIVTSIILALVCIFGTIIYAWYTQLKCQLTLIEIDNKLKEIVAEYSEQANNDELEVDKISLNVTNVSLKPSTDGGTIFSARIVMNDDKYGLALTEDSKYIVTTNSGQVYTYDVFGEHLTYNRDSNVIGKGIRTYGDLAKIEFTKISEADNIKSIKITDIEIFELSDTTTPIKNDVGIILYSAN